MKQVNPKYYDKKYFDFQSISPDYSKKLSPKKFYKKYLEMSDLVTLKPKDHICDLGCGNGDLSFLLSLKYHCRITSIDYSPDAINICKKNLDFFKKNTNPKPNIKFYNRDNFHLPSLKKIKAVYFCDVFEHLYPQEITSIVKTISSWGNPLIIVHTDNNFYLRFIEPLLNIFSLITKKTTLKQINQLKKFHQLRHVNLTNPYQLKKTMKLFNYQQIKLLYPKVDNKTIKIQLGKLAIFKPLIQISNFFIRLLPFLTPSFYSVYSMNHKDS